MATRPRMSAPIGRVRIKTATEKSDSGDRWRAAKRPVEAEADDLEAGEPRPQFYPFPLPSTADPED